MAKERPEHPGIIFGRDFIKPSGLNISEAAQYLGISRSTLVDLVQGKTSLSPVMALRMSQATDTKARYWMDLWSDFSLWQASALEPQDVKAFPLPKVI